MAVRKVKKKRKKNHVPFPALLVGILLLIGVLGLSYIFICSCCDTLGREIKQKEAELHASRKRLENEQDRWSSITAPGNLRRAIHKHGLGMTMPKESQITRVGIWSSEDTTVLVQHALQ